MIDTIMLNIPSLCGVYGKSPAKIAEMLENGELKSVIGNAGRLYTVSIKKLAKDLGETQEEAEMRAKIAKRLFSDSIWDILGEKWTRDGR